MQIKVLGLLEATKNGHSVLPSAAKPRQILALLALRAGQVVPATTLIEEVWGERPPPSARTTLQTYILRLRRPLGEEATELLATRYGGYLLNVAPEDVDVYEYERLSQAGRRAAEAEDYESAARLLRSALDVWRGPALVDVPNGDSLSIEATRLEENRLSDVETRIDAEMRCGRHNRLFSELAVLSARYPMNENLCAQRMIALFRSGRQWQALDAYQTLRRTLIEELGMEPSTRLRVLQRAILSNDPRLDRTEATEIRTVIA